MLSSYQRPAAILEKTVPSAGDISTSAQCVVSRYQPFPGGQKGPLWLRLWQSAPCPGAAPARNWQARSCFVHTVSRDFKTPDGAAECTRKTGKARPVTLMPGLLKPWHSCLLPSRRERQKRRNGYPLAPSFQRACILLESARVPRRVFASTRMLQLKIRYRFRHHCVAWGRFIDTVQGITLLALSSL
jgi:hypothetical protein